MRCPILSAMLFVICISVVHADDRLPLPDKAAQAEAVTLVMDVFGEQISKAKTAEQKSALVEKLIEQAEQPNTTPAGRFALYRTALDATVDAHVAMSIIDKMAKHFRLDAVVAKAYTLNSTVLDLTFIYVQRWQAFTCFPVVQASEFVTG